MNFAEKLLSKRQNTECARDCDLYKLVSCYKFVNEILFCIIYKTLYLTWGHHALGVILCLCLNFFEFSTAELFLQSQRSLKNYWFNIFVYEGQDPWHTRYKSTSSACLSHICSYVLPTQMCITDLDWQREMIIL
jgi:hypothetical protein